MKIQLKTPISYYGGKQKMLKHIIPLVPQHNLYTEVFAGGAALFFAKERSNVEVINDLNGELINFYQIIVSRFDELKKLIEKTLHSREQHNHACYIYNNPNYFTPVERAWAVLVLSKTSFSCVLSSGFGFSKKECTISKKLRNAKDAFGFSLKKRLELATIENDDAFKVLKRFDTPDAFHFLDPPYIGAVTGHYSGMFNKQNLIDLLDLCVNLKGKFMLTMFPNEDIKSYAESNNWVIRPIEKTITAGGLTNRRKQVEWLIMNY